MKQKRSFFEQNGGILLKQLLASSGDAGDQKALIFTEEELIKATNDFSTSNVIGQGGYGTVFKGTLANKQLVAIKRSKVIDQGQIEQFVNEVNLLSQINHPNVVKLLGCCLETPIPLLVYEFITNKTLFHHLHDANLASSLPWETRLKIATETASALAHMHSNNKIIHRDIKSANILLTNEYNAKVSDFGISRFVPPDKTHLSTLVQGTFGYIDPEYFHSGTLTDKSDVYSFGVLLVELLTGKDVLSLDREEKNRSLAMYFLSSVENDCFQHILEHRVKIEGDVHQLRGVAELAKNCLKITGMKRPTMEEVKQELEALGKQRHSVIKFEENSEEIQPLLNESSDFYGGNSSTTWFGTQGNQVAFDIEGGR
ncbi:Non-specific serine/threonine protein kinase [Bertholletia excelsa]